MAELGAVLESPEVDEAVEQVAEQPVETEVQQPEAAADTSVSDNELDMRKVPAELREYFKSPEGKLSREAWMERAAWRGFIPEGPKKLGEILAFYDEHGGQEGISTALNELRGKADELDGLRGKIESGDASLVTDLPPESLAKLAPAVVDQWRTADPEGWETTMSGIMAATINQSGVPMFLKEMGYALKYNETENLTKMLGQLQEWAAGFGQRAQAPAPQRQAVQPNKLDEREQGLNRREHDIFFSDMKREMESFREPLVMKELEPFIKRRPNDTGARDLAVRTVKAEVKQRMESDQAYQNSLNALTGRKDRTGALKLAKSREAEAIKNVAAEIGSTIFRDFAAPKVESVAPRKPTPPSGPGKRSSAFDAIWDS